jgi:hypothetical protein
VLGVALPFVKAVLRSLTLTNVNFAKSNIVLDVSKLILKNVNVAMN